uniref:Acyltransferase 3 domain-containing protein n=1 Tax=Chromera velia CCMP2878 TaxID=1169474 RepID=A0A0G4G4R9_9ALVE|eukprot:Cvel_20156.t1-p1 / transcript=Cvel_20156.t1 / gene=Cvel_20156 / organism=Chromera_velia_CCMP2878 / gene_product=hypothetical protein / transcript_product=hypothetical protein / location=Cvel_scaffold1790:4725-5765(-) / protein_length=347 / sequence_SO=supercontig / SO=protein_coding / is_pseudo=false
MGGTNLFLTAGPQQSNVDGALLLTQERPPSSSQLNLDTLSGLRGLCAVYIMIGHGLLFCTASSVLPRLFVPVQMPFFFLLSGFCLATANDRSARGGEGAHFDYWNFHWKRFARVYPTYILTNLLAVPLVFSGYTDAKPPSWPRMIPLALTCTATWGLFVHIPNVASWTICTLVFFYLLFPSLFLCLRKKSSVFLQRLEWSMDVLQFVVGMSLLHGIQWWFEKMHWHDPSKQFYWVPTTNPVSRLPIFLMGMSAGLLCSRKISSWKEATRAGEGGESGQQEEMGEEGDGATEASLPHPEGQGEAEEGSLLHGEAARAEGEKRNAATRADVWMLVWMVRQTHRGNEEKK